MTRVLLIDDHAVLREPLRFMFEREGDFEVAGEAGTLSEARKILTDLRDVGVAILDLDLPDGDGLDLMPELRAGNPECVILVLTGSTGLEEHARTIEAGADGMVHKSTRMSEVVDAARRLLAGEPLLSSEETEELLWHTRRLREKDRESRQAIEQLTSREREILQCLARGLSDKEIADQIYVTPGTVRNHVVHVLGKLGVNSRLRALVFAVRHGLVNLD